MMSLDLFIARLYTSPKLTHLIFLFITLAGPYDCTFEGGTCGYRNVEESEGLDTFDWTLRIAGTPSGNTGPTTDHTTGRFGNF